MHCHSDVQHLSLDKVKTVQNGTVQRLCQMYVLISIDAAAFVDLFVAGYIQHHQAAAGICVESACSLMSFKVLRQTLIKTGLSRIQRCSKAAAWHRVSSVCLKPPGSRIRTQGECFRNPCLCEQVSVQSVSVGSPAHVVCLPFMQVCALQLNVPLMTWLFVNLQHMSCMLYCWLAPKQAELLCCRINKCPGKENGLLHKAKMLLQRFAPRIGYGQYLMHHVQGFSSPPGLLSHVTNF